MNIKNLLGKLSIGRAGVSTSTGNIVRTGAPEDAFRSGAYEFIRKAQTESVEPTKSNIAKKRMTHPVVLVSRFKYPYVKTKKVPGAEEGDKDTRVETGEIGWKTTVNKDVADEAVNQLYAYELYLYHDTQTGQDLIIGQPIEEYLAKSQAKSQQPAFDLNAPSTPMEEPEWRTEQKAKAKAKAKRANKADIDALMRRFSAGEAAEMDIPTGDFSQDRENEPERYQFKGKITRFTTQPNDPEGQAAKLGAKVVPASEFGYRAYEVMPSPVAGDLYTEPNGEDESKIPTWTKGIHIPTEESPSAYGTSFRYRFSNGEPVPTLNGAKHVLSELLSVNGEKAAKDPGMNADFNIYEFMTANNLWDQMDNSGRLPEGTKAQIDNTEAQIESIPELEHFTLGGGSLVNLGGKKDSIMSEENLLARALWRLTNPSVFTYINNDGTAAFSPKNPDDKNISPLVALDKQLHAARQAYVELFDSLSPAERKVSPELIEAADKANKLGIKFVDTMAAKYPSKLREFVLKQPFVGHAPAGRYGKPGEKVESEYALSTTSHLSDNGRTIATYESGGGLQKLNDDDRKLYALVKAFERNADTALNNQARTLHSQHHAKLEDFTSKDDKSYKIPTPRSADGEWSEPAGKSIDFIEQHWLANHLLSTEDKNAISELRKSLAATGKKYTWGQAAMAYLKNQDRLKVKKYTQGAGMLGSTDHFLSQGPFTFEIPSSNEDEGENELITLNRFTPQSETAEKLKHEVLKQHLFNKQEVELAEYLAGRVPFENEDDALFSIWANWLIKAKRTESANRAEKALAAQEAKEKSKSENARGKPSGWPYALTSQKFSDEEREQFAGNLEDFVNTIKNQAGAVIDHHRKMVYINPDGSQVELPSALPVQLPEGARVPMPVSMLKRIKDDDVLAQYGFVRIKNALYSAVNSQPVTMQDGVLAIGDELVPVESLNNMTPSDIVKNYNIFMRDGKYYHVSEKNRVSSPVVEVIARGGEKISLPSENLGESGLQLLVKYVEQTTRQKLAGGQVHAFESDDDKIKMNDVYTAMLENGASPKNAYLESKKAVMHEKLNSVAVQCLSNGKDASPQHMKAAEVWIPKIIETLLKDGNKQSVEIIADNYDGLDNLMNAARAGRLDVDDAQYLVNTYNNLTGTTPQQGAYIKPIMQAVLLHGYQKESVPGLPNNKFWHMLMSNAGKRFVDRAIDTESGNDLSAQAMLHLMEKPESPLEGYDLGRILPKSTVSLLEKTLKADERRMQRANGRYKTGKRTVVEEWQAMPLPKLLANHMDWITNPQIFGQEMIDNAHELADTELVNQERKRLFPASLEHLSPADAKRLENIQRNATAMYILLQRQASKLEKYPQQDVWDIIMSEPGLDTSSPEWHAKHKLAQHEARIEKTSDSLQEQAKLREQLSIRSMFDVPENEPVIKLSNKDAESIIDQPMVNALASSLMHAQDRDRVSIWGRVNRAFVEEAKSQKSNHAKGVVYPKHSVALTDTSPIMITDDDGKERDVTGYTPEEYENINNTDTKSLYSDDKVLPAEILARINKNTRSILSGSSDGNSKTLLGEFRQKLNEDLMGENQGQITRAQRAEAMYTKIYTMVSRLRRSVLEDKETLAHMDARGAKKALLNKLKSNIENDTNILAMVESYNVFEHLAKMIHFGKEFGKNIDRLTKLDLEEKSIVDRLKDIYPSAQQSPMASAKMYEPEIADRLIEIGKIRTGLCYMAQNNAMSYDESAKELWNFVTRTTYMDKRNIVKGEANDFGVNISNEIAKNESRLSQDDRDEVANMVFDKLDKHARWFEAPSNEVPAYESSAIRVRNLKNIEPLTSEDKEITSDIDADELARFLGRRGVLFALEMGKLDAISGRQKTANVDFGDDSKARVKYTQDFTQPKDMSWFIHNWLENASVSDEATVPGRNGLSALDTAMCELERKFAKPGGIYWTTNGAENPLIQYANPHAMGYSLFAKYVDMTSRVTPAPLEQLMTDACNKISQDVDSIRASINYDQLPDNSKQKVDEAILIASNAYKNQGMKSALIADYTKKNNPTKFVGTDPQVFTDAKNAVSIQMANHYVIDDLVRRASENQLFVNNGSEWRFSEKETIAYIAHTVASEVVSSIKHLETPGHWELAPLSPVQLYTGIKPGEVLNTDEIQGYMSHRLLEFKKMLTEQWKVETVSDLSGTSSHMIKIDRIINTAQDILDGLLHSSMGGDGNDIELPMAQAMQSLHAKSQTVNTAFQEDLDEKINDPRTNLTQFHDTHVLPALLNSGQGNIELAAARAMRQLSSGESTWPIVSIGVKSKVRQRKADETQEDYDAFLNAEAKKAKKSVSSLTSYGPKDIKRINSDALRDNVMSQRVHAVLSKQIFDRLGSLKNGGDYNSAVKNSDRAHFDKLKSKGYYGHLDEAPTGTADFVHGNIGVLNLDVLHPLYERLTVGHQVGIRGLTQEQKNQRKPITENAPEPLAQPETVVDAQTPSTQAAVIDKLVRYATRLDARGRFAEADLVDSLIHKLEVGV